MLVLRQEQLDAFRLAREESLVCKIGEHLRRHCAEQCRTWSDDELRRFVRDAIEDAREKDVRSERSLYKYASIALFFGLPLDAAWMTTILRDAAVDDPDERVERLLAAAVVRLRSAERSAEARKVFHGR